MNKLALLPALALSAAGALMPAAAAEAAKAAPHGPSSLTVVRDPATGQMRAPTAEEAAALAAQPAAAAGARAQRQAVTAPQQPLLRVHAGGAVSMRMTDEMTSQVVAVRRAGGMVTTQCHDSKAAAKAGMSFAASATTAEAKE